MASYTGKVTDTAKAPRAKRWLTIEVDTGSDPGPKNGDRVTVNVTLGDEDFGRKVRETLGPRFDETRRDSLANLADAIESEGYPALADLIRDEI